MKKQLLTLAFVLILGTSLSAQSYFYLKSKGLVGTVNGTNYDYKKAVRGTGTTSVLAIPSDQTYSATQTLPFAWNFLGTPVTSYKVSDNGFLTFDLTETANPTTATTLPSTSAPKNAIFGFWYNFKLAAGGGVVDQVFSWTYGTAPNRIHVVQWLSVTTPGASLGSFGIRFYEGKGFDIVTNQRSVAIAGTIGYNNSDGTSGLAVAGAPSTDFDATSADDDYTTMAVYTFKPGTQPLNDIELTSLNIPKYQAKNSPLNFKGSVTNYGSQSLSSFKLNYSVDNGATVTMLLSGLSIASSGGTYSFTHNIPYIGTTAANSTVKLWVSNPNAGMDGDSSNNNATGSFVIVNSTIPRVVLHEVFTSSTCPPCKPGNDMIKSVLDVKMGSWNVIKYQMHFPGTGDPYMTAENTVRFGYYGSTYAPWLTVDGAWNNNANSYTEAIFDGFAAIPSLASLTANFSRTGKQVTVTGNVTPVQSFTNTSMKLRISIVERVTKANKKTNGELEFYNVNKKMLPDAAGTAVSFAAGTAVPYSQTYTFPGNYRLPSDGQAANVINLATENSVEDMNSLFAIVFLQDDADKTVWQSVSSGLTWPLGVNEINELGLNLNPNPAASSFSVTFTGSSSNGTIRILDINGKEVMTQNISSLNGTVNCDQLQNGFYFVELNVDGKTAVKKLNVIR